LSLLKTEKLTHIYSAKTTFERTAIHEIDFAVEKGECVGIIGHTGSGKSTLIKHLNALLRPTSGKVYFEGQDVNASKQLRRKLRFDVGLVFQYPEYQLFAETVFEDIAFGPKNLGLPKDGIEERVFEAAGFVGIDDETLKKSPFELSGGQKRRAAIAGVIAMRPQVVIFDEPTAGLDPEGRTKIMQNIIDYKNANNATIIIVTHNMEEVSETCERLVILENGKVAMDAPPAKVFSDVEFLGNMGLDAPKAAKIAHSLRARGLPLAYDIYTVPELVAALCKLKQAARIRGVSDA
jgi:energy-coupling factor transport system ATP-binding protein